MGALPDHAPPLGATRRPEDAPPLFAVSARPVPAPEPEEPEAPEGVEEVADSESGTQGPSEPGVQAPPTEPVDQDHQDHQEQEEFPALVGEPWWARLRPPDVWHTPAPTLAEEIARARRGDHLPESGPWRVAELVRTWISALCNAGLLLVVHANRSAARQTVLLLFVAVFALVLATR